GGRPRLGHDVRRAVHLPDRLHGADPPLRHGRRGLAGRGDGADRAHARSSSRRQHREGGVEAMTGFLTRTRGRGRLDWTDWFTYLYLLLGLFLMFGPGAWRVLSSFKTESAIAEFPPRLLPMGQKQVVVPGEEK